MNQSKRNMLKTSFKNIRKIHIVTKPCTQTYSSAKVMVHKFHFQPQWANNKDVCFESSNLLHKLNKGSTRSHCSGTESTLKCRYRT